MSPNRNILVALLVSGATLLLAGCEHPPVAHEQIGYRGTGMERIVNPRTVAANAALHEAPEAAPAVPADGPKATLLYKNLQVLGDLNVAEFNRTMAAMTQWVAPEQGCAHCHNPANFAEDSKYTKVVARRMIQMTRQINGKWQDHVKETGVTCYTCHRGHNIPEKSWFAEREVATEGRLLGNNFGQNRAGMASVANASLPYDPYTPYLLKANEIRVAGTTALPTGNKTSIKDAEATHGLMIHMSDALGVGCTWCHNTRAMAEWSQSTPQRVQAWFGIRMVREINNEYIVPLTAVTPPDHLGPTGDIAKANCATCHQGANKPLNGAAMAKHYPALAGAAKPADTLAERKAGKN